MGLYRIYLLAIHLVVLCMEASEAQYTMARSISDCESQLVEVNARIKDLEETTQALKQLMGEMNHTIGEAFLKENQESVYEIHYTLKSWMDADLSCKLQGGHLASFETMDEKQHVVGLIQRACNSDAGFWLGARDVGDENWIWRNSGQSVLSELWPTNQPDGDGNCGRMWTDYNLSDFPCVYDLCYICEVP